MTNKNKKIPVGVLGATGMVGQNYINLLENHPWFEVTHLAASPKSAGKKYTDALADRWCVSDSVPKQVSDIMVHDVSDVETAAKRCRLVFSAFEAKDAETIRNIESQYAKKGIPVFSNASAHRNTDDVPMLIPEINAHHIDIIPIQKKHYGWDKGFIVVKPNCSLQSYMMPLYALMKAGYDVQQVIVTTLQAVSGSGYPGHASIDMIDNVIPFINGEEEKSEIEPLKIFGEIQDEKFVNKENIAISAHCNRVPVIDGHIACVSIAIEGKKPTQEQVLDLWQKFRSVPQELDLPSAPSQPIVYRPEVNRPQPRRDRDTENGMATVLGRLRECSVFDYKFVSLSHNTVRGAAGGGILNAELLVAKKFIS